MPSGSEEAIFIEELRGTVKRVLTFWHAGCTFIISQTRTGAIPEAESQQNADGLDASLDCRRSALGEHDAELHHAMGRTASAQRSPRTEGTVADPPVRLRPRRSQIPIGTHYPPSRLPGRQHRNVELHAAPCVPRQTLSAPLLWLIAPVHRGR
jgi:hypothetical protein